MTADVMDDDLRTEVLAVLRRGLERVRTHWAAGPYIPRDKVCAALALAEDQVTGVAWAPTGSAYERALDALYDALPVDAGELMDWNDAQTSNAPVIALYERAIAAIEQQEVG
jgi:hypothetical protein